MRTALAILLAACIPLRADYSYQIRIQVTAGELYDALLALGLRTPGIRDAVVTTNLIKGNRMALIAKGHTTVIDLAEETITEIEFSKKTYSVIPFAQMKKLLEDAAAKAPPQAITRGGAAAPSRRDPRGRSPRAAIEPLAPALLSITMPRSAI